MAQDTTVSALLTVAVGTALFHTLIPDHWLPFVLMGRARGWSAATTAAVSGLSASIHVVLSLGLGAAALAIGELSAELVGESLEHTAAWLLVGFGGTYAMWAWRKGGHFHPGGARVHGEAVGAGCRDPGASHDDHLHYHDDAPIIRGKIGGGALWLAFIVGANPCILVLPLLVAAAGRGAGVLAGVALAYAIPSTLLMVGLSAVGVAGTRRIELPVAARHMEWASGALIAALGILLLAVGH